MAACAGVNYSTRDGALTLNGVLMHCPAWDVLNVRELWFPGDRRGSDVLIPGTPGALPQPRRLAPTIRTLNLVVTGMVDKDGDAYPSPELGLEENFDYLRTHVCDPFATGSDANGQITASLVMPSGATRTGLVTMESLVPGEGSLRSWRATIDMTITAGVLA